MKLMLGNFLARIGINSKYSLNVTKSASDFPTRKLSAL